MNLERMTGFNDPMPLTLGPAVRRVEPVAVKQDVQVKHRAGLVERPDGTLAYDPFKDPKNAPAPKVEPLMHTTINAEFQRRLAQDTADAMGYLIGVDLAKKLDMTAREIKEQFEHYTQRFALTMPQRKRITFADAARIRAWSPAECAKPVPTDESLYANPLCGPLVMFGKVATP